MNSSTPDKTSVLKRLEEAGRWLLNRNFPTAYLMVTRLGVPAFADVATACVRTSGDRIWLEFDPVFWDSLRLDELVGVLAHEALHVLLRHPVGPPAGDPMRLLCWNLACDAVVNDTLAHDYPAVRLPEGVITGQSLLGQDCHGLTAEEVLGQLLGQVRRRPTLAVVLTQLRTLDCHDAWAIDAESIDRVPGRLPPELEDAIEAIVCETARRDGAAVRAWGLGQGGRTRAVHERPPPIEPTMLLRHVIMRFSSSTPIWVPPNPKLSSVYPKLMLPRWEADGNARMLFAIDASASVGDEWLSAFAAIACAGRSRARVEAVSFDTAVYPLEPSDGCIRGGGGTSFQVIEDYIAALTPYPDAVVVMTDGEAERPSVRHPQRWLWLLAEHGSDDAIRGIGRIVRVRADT